MDIEQARKAGIASGLARLTPELIRLKAECCEMHQNGAGVGEISKKIGKNKKLCRDWLIQAGIYNPAKRGVWSRGLKKPKHWNTENLIVQEFESDIKLSAQWDEERHWNRHPCRTSCYYKGCTDQMRERARAYSKKNWKKRRIRLVLACRIRKALRHQFGMKAAKTMELIGCSVESLRSHLESKFTAGMTWDNYGQWHIDHIKPCALFDLNQEAQQRECFHYSNLQPLWAVDNIRKSDSYQA